MSSKNEKPALPDSLVIWKVGREGRKFTMNIHGDTLIQFSAIIGEQIDWSPFTADEKEVIKRHLQADGQISLSAPVK